MVGDDGRESAKENKDCGVCKQVSTTCLFGFCPEVTDTRRQQIVVLACTGHKTARQSVDGRQMRLEAVEFAQYASSYDLYSAEVGSLFVCTRP